VKILSQIERVRTRNFENKSEGEFYSGSSRTVQEILYARCAQRTKSELKDEEQAKGKVQKCLEAHLSKV